MPARIGQNLARLRGSAAVVLGGGHGSAVELQRLSPVDRSAGVVLRREGRRAGIRAGDVLTVVDGRPVRTPADVSASARAAAGGVTLDVRLM
jgi:membrane-associated protease RseP (regulator of RpoE activity)